MLVVVLIVEYCGWSDVYLVPSTRLEHGEMLHSAHIVDGKRITAGYRCSLGQSTMRRSAALFCYVVAPTVSAKPQQSCR